MQDDIYLIFKLNETLFFILIFFFYHIFILFYQNKIKLKNLWKFTILHKFKEIRVFMKWTYIILYKIKDDIEKSIFDPPDNVCDTPNLRYQWFLSKFFI